MPEAQRPAQRFSVADQIAISALWFAWFAQWMTIPPVILPDQVAGILGANKAAAEAATGAVVAAGAAVALLVTPVAGALSDRTVAAHGRRPFLVVGVLASCAALALLGLAGRGGSLLLYALAYLHLQFWWNWAAGPYAGLIPDVVPARQQAMASGWMNALSILGVIVGNLLVAAFYTPQRVAPILGIFIALSVTCLLATLLGVQEPAAVSAPRERQGLAAFLSSFYLSPRGHPDFYLVLATRLLSNMGIWSVLAFLLFYFESILGMTEAAASRLLPALLGAGACLAIPASLAGGRMADRHGLVRVVQVTSWIMAGTTGCYVLIALHPAVALVVPVVIVFSIANGAYGAADWYLALKVLPSGQDAGKDLGIWHVCMVLPQIVAPATTGVLISAVKTAVSARLAYGLAFGIGAFWFVLAAALVGRVRLAGEPAAVTGDRLLSRGR
jgi:MFS family permease